jgi:hypothetical protein
MTDELKKALFEDNVQCISECDGKFVLLNTVAPIGDDTLVFIIRNPTVQNSFCFL